MRLNIYTVLKFRKLLMLRRGRSCAGPQIMCAGYRIEDITTILNKCLVDRTVVM